MTLIDRLRTARVMLANYAAHDELQGQIEDAEYTRRVIEDIDMTLSISPPVTGNQYAAALIRCAAARCHGCRTAWRLDGWLHNNRMECRAKSERMAINDMLEPTNDPR